MFESKTPVRPSSNDDDPGFPPLRDIDKVTDGEDDDIDDLEADYHEDGGGD